METTSATTPAVTPPVAAAAPSARPEISSDFETFLKMLTVQMENQDPLNPVDSSDYAVQLATFSGVEQQVQTNTLLEQLQTQFGTSGMADMAALVGKQARAVAPGFLDGQPIQLVVNPDSNAEVASVVVSDQAGTEMGRFEVPVKGGEVTWAGVTSDGSPFPSGLYTFTVESYKGDELTATSQAEVYGTVQEVRRSGSDTLLIMRGGAEVPSNSVSAIRGG